MRKREVDIIGLPIVCINEGRKFGTVKQLVVNPYEGKVAALAIDDGKWYLGAKLIPFEAISGIGENAVTIEHGGKIVTLSSAPEYEKLLEADVNIIGCKVLTKNGTIQGEVVEIIFDLTGKIIFCEVKSPSGDLIEIPSDRVMTYGKEVVIISDADNIKPVAVQLPLAAPGTRVAINPAIQNQEKTKEITMQPVEMVFKNLPMQNNSKNPEIEPVKFDDKHRKHLVGRKAGRRIETDGGVLIVDQGGEITEEVIQKAKLAGKYVELSMNVQ